MEIYITHRFEMGYFVEFTLYNIHDPFLQQNFTHHHFYKITQ